MGGTTRLGRAGNGDPALLRRKEKSRPKSRERVARPPTSNGDRKNRYYPEPLPGPRYFERDRTPEPPKSPSVMYTTTSNPVPKVPLYQSSQYQSSQYQSSRSYNTPATEVPQPTPYLHVPQPTPYLHVPQPTPYLQVPQPAYPHVSKPTPLHREPPRDPYYDHGRSGSHHREDSRGRSRRPRSRGPSENRHQRSPSPEYGPDSPPPRVPEVHEYPSPPGLKYTDGGWVRTGNGGKQEHSKYSSGRSRRF